MDPTIPQGLALAVKRMLAKNPNDRFQTPGEVIEALSPYGPVEGATPVEVTKPSPPPRVRNRPRRRVVVASAIVLGAALAACLGGWGLYAIASSSASPSLGEDRSAR